MQQISFKSVKTFSWYFWLTLRLSGKWEALIINIKGPTRTPPLSFCKKYQHRPPVVSGPGSFVVQNIWNFWILTPNIFFFLQKDTSSNVQILRGSNNYNLKSTWSRENYKLSSSWKFVHNRLVYVQVIR